MQKKKKKLKQEVEFPQQADLSITIDTVTQFLRKVPNWKAPGPDMKFSGLHHSIANQLQVCLECVSVPGWMTKGRTVLIMKDSENGAVAGNCRPITCLPVMWKVLTGIISDKLYEFLCIGNVLPDEQKGRRKGSQGTSDKVFIDKMVLREAKSRKKNLAMGWIDHYKNVYDMIPHSWMPISIWCSSKC